MPLQRPVIRYVVAGAVTVIVLTAFPVLSYFLGIVMTGDVGGPLNVIVVPGGSCLFSLAGVVALAVPLSLMLEYLLERKLRLAPVIVWLAGGLVFLLLAALILALLFSRPSPFTEPRIIGHYFYGILGGVFAGPIFWSVLRLLARAEGV